MRSAWQELYSRLDKEILELSRTSGRIDGTTALAGLQLGEKLFVANAGKRLVYATGLPRQGFGAVAMWFGG